MDKMINPGSVAADSMSDNEVIAQMLKGEKDLYAILVRRYNQRLYRVAMAIVNNDAEVEDIMQVAYIKAYENLQQFGARSSFSTWLTRILINESLLRVKKRKRSAMDSDQLSNEIHQQSQTPLMTILNTELKAAIENAIRQLPEKYRTVFVMRTIEGMNIDETKECLNLSEANVKVRLNRAKAMLQDSLSAYYKNEDILHFHLSRCDRVTENVMETVRSREREVDSQ